MKIFLIGYMGSGKSILAKVLAERLNLELIDIDAYIESQIGQSVSDIFAIKGEKYFRNLESKILSGLNVQDNVVIATGGGLPCFNDNINVINKQGVSFYICNKVETLSNRLFLEKSTRPLISTCENISELSVFVKKHLEEREQYYFQAKYIINGDQSIGELVEDVVWFLNQN